MAIINNSGIDYVPSITLDTSLARTKVTVKSKMTSGTKRVSDTLALLSDIGTVELPLVVSGAYIGSINISERIENISTEIDGVVKFLEDVLYEGANAQEVDKKLRSMIDSGDVDMRVIEPLLLSLEVSSRFFHETGRIVEELTGASLKMQDVTLENNNYTAALLDLSSKKAGELIDAGNKASQLENIKAGLSNLFGCVSTYSEMITHGNESLIDEASINVINAQRELILTYIHTREINSQSAKAVWLLCDVVTDSYGDNYY